MTIKVRHDKHHYQIKEYLKIMYHWIFIILKN